VLLATLGKNDNDCEFIIVFVSAVDVVPRPAMIYAPTPPDTLDVDDELVVEEELAVVVVAVSPVDVRPRPAMTYAATPFVLVVDEELVIEGGED
jgi:hypothetical protein